MATRGRKRQDTVDKVSIAKDYRSNLKTLEQIGIDHGISESYVRKLAKEGGWERDLGGQIRARTAEKVAVAAAADFGPDGTLDVIETNATQIASVELTQRDDIRRFRGIVTKLLDAIEPQIDNPQDFKRLAELMAQEGDAGQLDKLNELYRRVISLPGTVDMAGKLATTLKILIELERKVLRMDDTGGQQQSTVEDLLRKIGRE